MPTPDSIRRLVNHFDQNRSSFLSPHYKEAQLRQDFLDPFFVALGWDVTNKIGYSELYRDVVIESSVEVEGAAKAPDYSFRIGGNRKFFVEAKKPSVNIEYDIHPAFQVRRYAWSAKLPLSILTDFEEFAVYDCRTRPDKSDKAATGRVKLLNYKDYLTRWDEISDTFSKDAVLHGKLDQFAEYATGKRGTQEVDDAFLQEIEKWRDLLARNLALRNPNLNTRELNYAVQMTIDRIIFLRICEDRQIESENRLKDISSGEGIYPELVNFFRQADARYNSGLFHFTTEKGQSSSPDDLTPTLAIDDKVLKEIVSGLYYPSPYVFRVLPADILGQVYERFLGKVIRLTAGHQAKVEEKPEVRKAGGVYYTPTYIVEYIIKNTVGKILENKTIVQAANLKIVDPACGSGSFLLGAYQYLLDWYVKWYSDNQPEKWARGKSPAIYQAQGGWRLTTAEKKKILLNNIHGVDIDPQAVEVTKLSLSLKVLEDESLETIKSQMSLFKERALPDLGKNIQCGNSLIGSDYNEGKLFDDEEERLRVNPFDWPAAFPQVSAQGGFDIVIGNPPYIRIQAMKEWAPLEVELYKKQYKAANKGNYDIYVVFVEKGISLLNQNGKLGFILPHKFFNAQYGEPLRKIISERKLISKIVNFGDQQVFQNATTYTCLLFLENLIHDEFWFEQITDINDWKNRNTGEKGRISINVLEKSEWNFSIGSKSLLYEKLDKFPVKLVDVADRIFQGLVTGADPVFILKNLGNDRYFSEATKKVYELESKLLHPLCKGSVNIKRYFVSELEKSILFPYISVQGKANLILKQAFEKDYPLAWLYLQENRRLLESREHNNWKNERWYAFGRSQNLNEMDQQKILTPSIASVSSFTLDIDNFYYFVGSGGGGGGGYGITLRPNIQISYEYILGLLNSKLLSFYLKSFSSKFSGGYFAYNRQYIAKLPIYLIDLKKGSEYSIYSNIVSCVKKMLLLTPRTYRTPQEKETLQREIASTDRQIDNFVYQLYGLTPEEIDIVEGEQ